LGDGVNQKWQLMVVSKKLFHLWLFNTCQLFHSAEGNALIGLKYLSQDPFGDSSQAVFINESDGRIESTNVFI